MPRIDRALTTARRVEVKGLDLFGAEQKLAVRICEVGPYLALKLRAFHHRQQPKDAFDIVYTVLHYDQGIQEAIEGFAQEIIAGNPACPDALATLQEHFSDESSPGPVKASHFVFGEERHDQSEETRIRRTQVRQDMVEIASRLLAKA